MGKKNAESMQFGTVDEFKKFIEFNDNPISALAYKILFWAGIRSGELLALTFKDIDLDNKIIDINRTFARLDGKDVINETDRIFHFTKYFLHHEMQRVCKKSGVKPIRIHDLRHSYASLLVELGFTPLLISERLGHEKVQATLNTYSHLYPNKGDIVANRLNDFY